MNFDPRGAVKYESGNTSSVLNTELTESKINAHYMYVKSIEQLYSFGHNHIFGLCENCCIPFYSDEEYKKHISYGMCLKNDVSAIENMPLEYEANLNFYKYETTLPVI